MLTHQQVRVKSSHKYTWNNGLFSEEAVAKLLAGESAIGRRRLVFDILLDHVHICVLHAWNMVIKKVVHMCFMHVWTIGDVALQKHPYMKC